MPNATSDSQDNTNSTVNANIQPSQVNDNLTTDLIADGQSLSGYNFTLKSLPALSKVSNNNGFTAGTTLVVLAGLGAGAIVLTFLLRPWFKNMRFIPATSTEDARLRFFSSAEGQASLSGNQDSVAITIRIDGVDEEYAAKAGNDSGLRKYEKSS